jgi:3-oxoacyl-[acyl-carrier protein] reductase
MKSLKRKVAIVSGGSRGIGRACCLALAREGATVVFTYSRSHKEAEALAAELKSLKADHLCVRLDVKDFTQCKYVIDKTIKRFKKLDILVNNAGITIDKPLFLMSNEEWSKVLDTNLNGTYNMTRAAITPLLKQKSGSIISMSSVSGISGTAGQTNYGASKAGIIGFSKSLAREAAPFNVRVNVIAPGFINTDMVRQMNADTRKKYLATIPMKTFGEPSDVAELCVFLASDKSKYITGEVVKIDGGLAM